MRILSLGFSAAAVLGLFLGACGGGDPATPDANPLGQVCEAGDPCGNAGLTCVESVCTTTGCAASTDCRSGTECRNVDGTFACVAKTWGSGQGQYGTNCAIGGQSVCAGGYACLSVRDSDPYAYCTTACSTDRQCPPNYLCGTESGDPTMKCIRRELCAPCDLNEQCVVMEVTPDGLCGDDGSGVKACTKACNPAGETCPPVFACTGPDDLHCTHKSGACTGDGSMCAPCQVDADCAGTTGSRCFRLYFSGEKFCAPPCGAGCPAGSYCAATGAGNLCIPDNPDNSCEDWPF